MLRSIAERISRGIVLKRTLPADLGGASLFVTPDAQLRYWLPDLSRVDPALLDAAREFVRVGDVVWDVGANVGLFTYAAAGLTGSQGTVISIEPDGTLVELLRRSRALLGERREIVRVVPVAVSDAVDLVTLHISARGRASNSLLGAERNTMGGARDSQQVVTVTLDWLAERLPPPNVLKIDVEGLEDRVIDGAGQLLQQHRPVLICEVSDPSRAEKIAARLRALDYEFYDMNTPRSARHPIARMSFNTIALWKHRTPR